MASRVFLHIGAPKSGTTFLQQVMGRNSTRLREQGVLYAAGRYPADRVWATEVLRGLDHSRHPKPHAAGAWERILEQVRGWDGTAVISHEFFCACSADQARRALDDLAPAEVELIFTARDYIRQGAAAWQERLKFRHTTRLRDFTLDDDSGTPLWSWRTQDVVEILDRWGRDVPPERVHLVTVPQSGGTPGVLWERFAGVVGVDPASCDTGKARSNTSLGVAEAELLRRVNERLGADIPNPREAARWVRDMLAHGILARRGGERFAVHPDVAEVLRERSRGCVEDLREREFDVVGDLTELLGPDNPPATRHPDEVDDAELLDAALDTIAGLLREVKRQTRRAEKAEQATKSAQRTERATTASRGMGERGKPGEQAAQRSPRQAVADLTGRYPFLSKARARYRRIRPSR